MQKTPFNCLIRGRHTRALRHYLLGGYRVQDRKFVLVRRHATFGGEKAEDDYALELLGPDSVQPVPPHMALDFDAGDWETLAQLSEGKEFRLHGQTGTKLHVEPLGKLIHNKLFVSAVYPLEWHSA